MRHLKTFDDVSKNWELKFLLDIYQYISTSPVVPDIKFIHIK